MPKKKSNRAASKRFRKTGRGKFKRNRAYKSHILTSKNRKRKRRLRKATIALHADLKRLRRMVHQ